MTHDLRIRCDLCVRGIVQSPIPGSRHTWPDACKICRGRGSLSLATLCKYIDENESTVAKLFKPNRRMRSSVCARICGKLMKIVDPPKPKQPELF